MKGKGDEVRGDESTDEAKRAMLEEKMKLKVKPKEARAKG